MSGENAMLLNKLETRERIVEWVKTTRVQTAMVTALALWIGHVTVSPLTWRSAITLGAIGVLIHIWGFTLNEVEDYEYDAREGDASGHPIAKGKVHAGIARNVAWISALLAVSVSAISLYPIEATLVLLISFVPGYMYDKWSKAHWWSNIYLSMWAALMVLAGSMYYGDPNLYTYLVAVAVGIQIFVQVIEGDLKDIKGSERTFAERLGVNVDTAVSATFDTDKDKTNIQTRSCEIVNYTRKFTSTVYGLKFLEVALLFYIALSTANLGYGRVGAYFTLMVVVAVAFMTSVSMFLVYCFDRDEIKKKSSIHELTSIVLLGVSVAWLDSYGAILVAIAPIIWYLTVNFVIHSGSLNPDI